MSKATKYFKKHAKSFNIPIFGGSLHVFYERDKFEKAMKLCNCPMDKSINWYGGICAYTDSSKYGTMTCVGIFDYDVSTCVHEAVHAAQATLQNAGVDDDETEAYFTQWVFEQIYNNLPKGESN